MLRVLYRTPLANDPTRYNPFLVLEILLSVIIYLVGAFLPHFIVTLSKYFHIWIYLRIFYGSRFWSDFSKAISSPYPVSHLPSQIIMEIPQKAKNQSNTRSSYTTLAHIPRGLHLTTEIGTHPSLLLLHKSQKLETAYLFINWWINSNMHNGILLSC